MARVTHFQLGQNVPQRQAYSLRRVAYRMGYKRCHQCGALDVWRAYEPQWVGWSTWCYTCGDKDGQA